MTTDTGTGTGVDCVGQGGGHGFPPCAPLFEWVKSTLVNASLLQLAFYGFATGPIVSASEVDQARQAGRDHELGHFVDLRHGGARYALLRAMEDSGHLCAWALGMPWTPLTDEQAGRLVAEMIRRLGPGRLVPEKPLQPLPVAVLGEVQHLSSADDDWQQRDSLADAEVRIMIRRTNYLQVAEGSKSVDFRPAWDVHGCPLWQSSPTVILVEDLEPPTALGKGGTP